MIILTLQFHSPLVIIPHHSQSFVLPISVLFCILMLWHLGLCQPGRDCLSQSWPIPIINSSKSIAFFLWSIITLQCCVSFCRTTSESAICGHIATFLGPPSFPSPPSKSSRSTYWAPCATQQLPTGICFTRDRIYVSPNLPVHPTLTFPTMSICPYVYCLCLYLCSCSENRSLCTIFLDFTYMH